jgi:hypothetical protein
MEPNILARIAVRIVAIYIIAQGMMYLPSIYTVMLYNDGRSGIDVAGIVAVIAAIFGPLVVGVVLWLVAPALSRWIVGAIESGEGSSATSGQIQAVAISTAGLIIVFISLPGFISLLVQTFGGAYEFEGQRIFSINTVANLLASGLKVLFGVLLILGVRFWIRLLHRFKEFGLEEKSSNKRLKDDAAKRVPEARR